jgi:hypothetical protein
MLPADHHVDPAKDCFGVKFCVYLDPLTADNGALRIIPGSHRDPLHSALREMRASPSSLAPETMPCHVCESTPGDVIAFDMRASHAAFNGFNGRRLCTVLFYATPKNDAEVAGARWRVVGNCRGMLERSDPEDLLFHADWLANRNGSSERAYSISRLRELGFLHVPTEHDRQAIDDILAGRASAPLTGSPFNAIRTGPEIPTVINPRPAL